MLTGRGFRYAGVCLSVMAALSAVFSLKGAAQTATQQAQGGNLMSSEKIDALWDYQDPAGSCKKFQEALIAYPESADEIRTQIARSLGLQRKFAEGKAELSKISAKPAPIVAVRIALEAGRLENSAGNKTEAKPFFQKAWRLAKRGGFDFYAVDAAHMMAIATSGSNSLLWNQKAIALAEKSQDIRAQNWQGSLLNNTGWTYHDMGRYDKALELFNKALAYQKAHGEERNIRIANWAVGRCLRSLKRYEEALAIQRSLEAGAEEGYVSEEIGELLFATGRSDDAKPYFARAYGYLSKDIWLKANEPARLERLRRLSE